MLILKFIFNFIFLFLNFFILYFDIKEKKIPNKFLLGILLLFPFFLIFNISQGNTLSFLFFIQIIVSIIISFILYYFWVWSAGDAKYLLVLSLFLWEIWVVPFIGNIAVITLTYLFIFFIYFYWKVIIDKDYRKSLFKNIWTEQKDKINIFLKHPVSWKIERIPSLIKILKQILYFLLFFVSLRLFRLDITNELQKIDFIQSNIKNLKSYFILWWGIISFTIFFAYKLIFQKIRSWAKKIFTKNLWIIIKEEYLKIINIFIAVWFLFFIIIFDYIRNGNEIFHKLELILGFYLWLSFFIRILMYSYKITFQIGEQSYILIKNLQVWEIIDKNYLIPILGTQSCLWYWEKSIDWIMYPNPWEYIRKIENPIDNESVELLRKIYKITNDYHKKNNTPWFSEMKHIKILKTFSFWPYILIWFLITFFSWDIIGVLMGKFWNIFIKYLIHK